MSDTVPEQDDPSMSARKFTTINDLADGEADKERLLFIKKNSATIRKYLGVFGIIKLKKGFFARMFMRIPEIEFNKRYMSSTEVCFSQKQIYIPSTLAIASEMLLARPVIDKGVFRINSTQQRLKDAKSLLFDLAAQGGGTVVERGREILDENFDPIDIAEAYKQIIRGFNITVIPETLIPLIKRIEAIVNEKEKKRCTKALLYALPSINRQILENDVYLCYALLERMKRDKSNKEQMGIEGMGVVMMPNLFMKYDANLGIADVLVLVEFSKFLFKNFRELIVSETKYEDCN